MSLKKAQTRGNASPHLLPTVTNAWDLRNFLTLSKKTLTIRASADDISVVKHFAPPYWDRLLVDAKLLQNAEQFHFRPFNDRHRWTGKLSVELQPWLPFLEKTIALWLQGKQDGREFFSVPEMGPVRGGYNLAQLPNSWEDAKILLPLIDRAWKKALAARY